MFVRSFRRAVSSKSRNVRSHDDKKMEALVSLYHQSGSFITPENLSAVIDQAFTQPLSIADDQKKHSFPELVQLKERQTDSTKVFLGAPTPPGSEAMGPGWTESRSRRIDQVHRALMGVQADGRPSWLALKENSERVKSQMDRDD